MTHLTDDELTLSAFGEATPHPDREQHLLACARCQAELSTLTRLVGLGRTLGDVELVTPPDAVWAGIHSELTLSEELGNAPLEHRRREAPPVRRDVVSRRARLRRPRRTRMNRAALGLITAAALLVGLVAGIVGTTLASRPGDPQLVAEAVLEPFPGWSATGSARVEEDATGSIRIVVDAEVDGLDGGLREVWLLDPETSGLISLGLLDGGTTTFSLPSDIDLLKYSVVDISQEPTDGDPAHSGDSIVRGALQTT